MPAIGAVTRQSFGTVGATLASVQFALAFEACMEAVSNSSWSRARYLGVPLGMVWLVVRSAWTAGTLPSCGALIAPVAMSAPLSDPSSTLELFTEPAPSWPLVIAPVARSLPLIDAGITFAWSPEGGA